ncbi:MAG: Hpt domain-containing protein [Elusimicrobiales bacterium]
MPDKAKERILEELGGIDEAVYDGLVADFAAQTAAQLAQARAAALSGDMNSGAEIMHSVKGCAANLRLLRSMEAALAAETAFKAGHTARGIVRKLAGLETAVKSESGRKA